MNGRIIIDVVYKVTFFKYMPVFKFFFHGMLLLYDKLLTIFFLNTSPIMVISRYLFLELIHVAFILSHKNIKFTCPFTSYYFAQKTNNVSVLRLQLLKEELRYHAKNPFANNFALSKK